MQNITCPAHAHCALTVMMATDGCSFLQVVTVVTMCISFVSMTASIFGQNLYFNAAVTPLSAWQGATWTSVAVALIMLFTLLQYTSSKGLLFVP